MTVPAQTHLSFPLPQFLSEWSSQLHLSPSAHGPEAVKEESLPQKWTDFFLLNRASKEVLLTPEQLMGCHGNRQQVDLAGRWRCRKDAC